MSTKINRILQHVTIIKVLNKKILEVHLKLILNKRFNGWFLPEGLPISNEIFNCKLCFNN